MGGSAIQENRNLFEAILDNEHIGPIPKERPNIVFNYFAFESDIRNEDSNSVYGVSAGRLHLLMIRLSPR